MNFFPNAKINLGLNITEKRKDGFHSIESVFVPISWTDELEIILSESNTRFSASGISIPGNAEDNLCLKAYYLLKSTYHLPEVKIHLKKNVPIGAGLGGGSSDAAFVLKGLNQLLELKLSDDKLQEYARLLGSDCAFFIKNKPVLAIEKGDVFKEIELDLSDYYIVLVYPNIHVSTAMAYSGVVPKVSEYSLSDRLSMKPDDWKDFVHNDFESSIFKQLPELEAIKSELYSYGAFYASMSGSGSTMYGLFKSIPPKVRFENCIVYNSKLII
tara:strand:+ start:1434 stop:2246 length:813 start_codon:yes stop_codon:yes gene_type:complete